MSKKAFDKFINQKSNAAKKEGFKQQKRKIKKELTEAARLKREQASTFRRQTDNFQVTYKNRSPQTASQQQPASEKSIKKNVRPESTSEMPLNKFVAYAGVCARRAAADLVKQGNVTVNDDKVFEPSYRVKEGDIVKVNGKRVSIQKNLVYILLNKPKDYITTSKDPQNRKTVLDIVKTEGKERIFPVGRLDRNTTGVLLLTNDGELAQKLTHPSFEVRKIYEAKLDKELTKADFEKIISGVTLDDGFIKADALAYADTKDRSVVGIEIHSGKNRIVRRIFEHLGYSVKNLDRVMFANLTKKNVDRGKYRLLNEKEVRALKFLNQSFLKKKSSDNDSRS